MTTRQNALKELLNQSLARMYYAENQLVRALERMAKAATDPELKQAFLDHRTETKGHVDRLSACFAEVMEQPRANYCAAIIGLLENGNWAMHTLERGPALDAALIATAQQVELFEVASYRSLCGLARMSGLSKLHELCEGILFEEQEADNKLSGLAARMGADSGLAVTIGSSDHEQEAEQRM